MFKIEDIAMLIKSCSEKKLKEFLNIKDLEYSHLDSSSMSVSSMFVNKSTIKFRIFFKIKQCVNNLELSDNINSIITEGLCLSLNIDYKAGWYMKSIHANFRIADFKILNCSKTKVGIRGNVKYIYLSIYISNDLDVVSTDDNIEFKIKTALRNNKLSQLGID